MAAAEPGLPDAAAYVAPPSLSEPVLSPDGQYIAARTLIGGTPRFAIFDIARGAAPRPVELPPAERLEWYRWANGGTLLVSLLRQGAAPATRLVSVDLASGALRQLGPVREAGVGDEILHVDRGGRFLLLKRELAGESGPSVWRVDLRTGDTALAVAAQRHVRDWYVDSAGVVRAGVATEGDRSWLLYRKGEGDHFSRTGQGAGGGQLVPVRGSDSGYTMAETPSGRVGLYAYDFRRGRLGRLIYENPHTDVDGFETGADGQLLGVRFSGARDEVLWFDPRSASEQTAIDAALPGGVNTIVSANADKSRLLVHSRTAANRGAYYIYANGRAELFAAVDPGRSGRGAEMREVTYKARDGLAIRGFLTLPPGRAPASLPLIVVPHGGPFARDEWGYDPWVQFLADRGYAVLQPGFRGTTGRGYVFMQRGDGEWGRGMQNDIDDGVAALAGKGLVDAGRVCIMGASFGGYAAMWAAARDPGKYRCAISFAGISDLGSQLAYDRQTFDEGDFRAWRHRIQGKAASLESLSPLSFAGRMVTPMLIGHGEVDDVVPPEQSIQLHLALSRLGRAHEYVAYKGEGHNIDDPANAADFLSRVGRFLARYNPS